MKEATNVLSATVLVARLLLQQSLASVSYNHNCLKHLSILVSILHTVDPPGITAHPNDLVDAVPGKEVVFTVEATETGPLNYQWQWTPAGEEKGWQQCDGKWCQGTTLRIPCVQKLNEGSYQCVVNNRAGSLYSKEVKLSIGKNPNINHIPSTMMASCCFLFLRTADPPQVTTHPKGKDAVVGESITFTVNATGTKPLRYQWRWKLFGSRDERKKEEWQLCDVKRSNGHTLTISSVQKSNEGSYHCVISNRAGSQTSEPAVLTVGKNPIL